MNRKENETLRRLLVIPLWTDDNDDNNNNNLSLDTTHERSVLREEARFLGDKSTGSKCINDARARTYERANERTTSAPTSTAFRIFY